MITLIQRVNHAAVRVDHDLVGQIGPGILALVAVERADSRAQADRLLDRILGYRIFPDAAERMNLSLADTGGGLLLVSQFTLAADTAKGMRASFTRAAAPDQGRELFEYLLAQARTRHPEVATGRFGAHMQIELVNDGPVTFWLRARPPEDPAPA
jgi:D-tyrosyl-tRNA(Tyr) deacylase